MSLIKLWLETNPITPAMDLELVKMCEHLMDHGNAIVDKYWWGMLSEDAPCFDGTFTGFITCEEMEFTQDEYDALQTLIVVMPAYLSGPTTFDSYKEFVNK